MRGLSFNGRGGPGLADHQACAICSCRAIRDLAFLLARQNVLQARQLGVILRLLWQAGEGGKRHACRQQEKCLAPACSTLLMIAHKGLPHLFLPSRLSRTGSRDTPWHKGVAVHTKAVRYLVCHPAHAFESPHKLLLKALFMSTGHPRPLHCI